LPYQQQKKFLVALFKTGQTHVNNFIISNGYRPSADEQNWPLYTTEGYNRINFKAAELIELIDPVNGLLDEMVAVGCINVNHEETIKAQNTIVSKNDVLLTILKRRSVLDYNRFISCLDKTKQYHVVWILKPNAADRPKTKPLSNKMKKKLLVNQPSLQRLIDLRHGLLADLVAADCITWRHKEFIESASSQSDSNSRLLKIIMRGSEADFHKFIVCSSVSGQQHVCRILKEDGVVGHLVARCNRNNRLNVRTCLYNRTRHNVRTVDGSNVKRQETHIVAQFTSFLMQRSAERRSELLLQLVCEINECVQLIAVDKASSIGLYYWCTSLMGLLSFTELYMSGKLQLLLNRIFTALVDSSQSLIIGSLSWDKSEFFRCTQYMYDSIGMTVFSEIYLLAQQRKNIDTNVTISPFLIEQLPRELLEIIVIRAAAILLTVLNPVNPLAEVYVVATLCAVSSVCRRMLTNRKYLKRCLKHYFKRLCHPFKCRSQEVSKLCVESDVAGISEFRNKLYVACDQSKSIIVFNGSPPFDILGNIQIQEMKNPNDIVVCIDTSQLYIADYEQRAIWRVNLLSYKQVDKFISTQWQPFSLSTKSRRLLITPYDGNALFIYGDDGVLMKHIQLPHYMRATHAVETTHNTYIVSHYSRLGPGDTLLSEHTSVSEIDINGRVVRIFNSQHNDIGSIQFNVPQYLALAGNNHVIVADRLNERIVVLNEDLQLKRVLINSSHGQQPRRLCLSQRTGLLFIAMDQSSDIHVYDVLQT
jgi:hypothetical protein